MALLLKNSVVWRLVRQEMANLCEFGLIATMIKRSDTILCILIIMVVDKPIPTKYCKLILYSWPALVSP